MEITSVALISFSKLLGEWVGGIASKLGANKKEYLNALYAVQDALTVTRSYIAHLDRGNERDFDKEEALSKLWNSASNNLNKVGEWQLAEKCGLKGYYWAAVDSWNESEYVGAEIEVNKVFNDVQKLLMQIT